MRPLLPSLALLPALSLAATPEPRWELGAFSLGASQLAYPGSDQQIQRGLLLPYAMYRGPLLRADSDGAGLRAVKDPRYEFDVGFAASFGSGGKDIEARRGMRALGTRMELGPRLRLQLGQGPAGGRWQAVFPLRAVLELQDGLHDRGWAFEPELIYSRKSESGWRYAMGLGAITGDRRLADGFYGVRADQVLPDRAAYQARAGLIAWRLNTTFSKALGADWRVFGGLRLETVEGAANRDSPLVRRRAGTSVAIGLSYVFARSNEPGVD